MNVNGQPAIRSRPLAAVVVNHSPRLFTPWLSAFHRRRGFRPIFSETFGAAIRPTLVTNTRFAFAALLLASGSFISAETKVSQPAIYSGMCDASAAVALTDRLFAVASDEDSVIRVYHRDQGGAPVQIINLSPFLDLDPKRPESDLEGAARAGDRIYWI